MEKIDYLFKTKKISRIIETERERYLNFFSNSYKENLEHCRYVLEKYPRWSIISGYARKRGLFLHAENLRFSSLCNA